MAHYLLVLNIFKLRSIYFFVVRKCFLTDFKFLRRMNAVSPLSNFWRLLRGYL